MFHVIIPARYGASRLPGKPLISVAGRPLLQWVWDRAMASGAVSVAIATDDERIVQAAGDFGATVVMTSAEHASGTDRIAEVVSKRGFAPDEIVVNLQGDEPMVPAAVIGQVAAALAADLNVDIATAIAPVATLDEFLDANCVKVLRAADGRALYFSRAPVPWPRDASAAGRPNQFSGAWRHIGIYAYRVSSLLKFAGLPATRLEQTEKLEQLRALESGMRIQLVSLNEAPPPGVDTPDDLDRIARLLNEK